MKREKKGICWLSAFLVLLFILFGCSQAPEPTEPQQQRVDLVWPKPPDIPRIRFITSFSSPQEAGIKASWQKKLHRAITGKKEQTVQVISPFNIYVDEEGRIYITDTFTRSVHIFDRRYGKYQEISSTGKGPLFSPIGIAVDKRQNIYVSDSILNGIFVFDKKAKPIFSIGSGELKRPTGIAINNEQERLYVVDTLDHKIKIFDLQGRLLQSFGARGTSPGEFNFPTCICVDRGHRVYVGDSMNFRIQIFNERGNLLSSFGQAGDGTGFFSQIKGVAVDSEGHIYVTDAQFDVVQIFEANGDFLLSFGEPGHNPGEFQLPSGIFIDRSDNIYVADRLNQRIQIFKYLNEEK